MNYLVKLNSDNLSESIPAFRKKAVVEANTNFFSGNKLSMCTFA